MSILKMYFASNDALVSEEGTFTNAISFTLRADENEQQAIRLYAMTDVGYQSTATTVEGIGTTVARWQLAPDNNGSAETYVNASTGINLSTVGAGAGRVYFWARAQAVDTESIGVDNSVTLKLEGIGEAV